MELRLARLLVSTALSGVVLAAGATPALGQIDDLPPLPPLPKPSAKASFELIVEGDGVAGQTINGSGSNGVCQISTSTKSGQIYRYGRGRGVDVIFTKYKFPGGPPLILLKRKGQNQGVTFTVVGSYENSATGSAIRSGAQLICMPTTELVGDEEECGRKAPRRIDLFLNATFDGALTLGSSVPVPSVPGFGCGANGVETVSGSPLYGWPSFPVLEPGDLPVDKIFGRKAKNRFKVDFEAVPINEEAFFTIGSSFVIRSINTGQHTAVARFVREGKRK